MELTLTEEVSKQLAVKSNLFLLTLNDGSNAFSNAEGCCMIGERFLIVPVTALPENYQTPIPSNHFTFFTSDYDTMFLKGQLKLSIQPSSGTMVLKNEGGILDSNVQIKSVS